MDKLEDAANDFKKANIELVQIVWDLGDNLRSVKENSPEFYDSLKMGLGISDDVERAWLRVRSSAEDKKELLNDGNQMRQAMLAICVPQKQSTEERVELSPPQTFYSWVNKSNSWLKKIEYGLAKCDKDQLKNATAKIYSFLKHIHEE